MMLGRIDPRGSALKTLEANGARFRIAGIEDEEA
jgi:hypothetical protein